MSYDKEEIERLARKYIETANEEVFGKLLEELEPIIRVQLGKNYSSLKDYWDDMTREVMLKLWKNRKGVKTTTARVVNQFYWNRISCDLNRASKKMNKLYRSEDQLPTTTRKDGEGEGSHLGDFIEDKVTPSPSETVININLREQIREALESLTEREAKVLKMRFGLGDGKEHTLEEVGRQFKVTRERIRQIEVKALKKLKQKDIIHILEGLT